LVQGKSAAAILALVRRAVSSIVVTVPVAATARGGTEGLILTIVALTLVIAAALLSALPQVAVFMVVARAALLVLV